VSETNPKCVECGRVISEFEMREGGALFGNKRGINIGSTAPMKCDQCDAWLCNLCMFTTARVTQFGGIAHKCGGHFEYQK